MNSDQLRDLVIKPTLQYLGMYSHDAENLMAGTCAVESRMGEYIKQLGNGPALGIFQMEPATHDDIWDNYISYRRPIADKVKALMTPDDPHTQLITNLAYATAMARIHYWRQTGKIPSDLEGQAKYWKDHYNTHLGAGTVEKYIDAYKKYA